ncbi:MAG: class I SAM-dependent methyltransferase [Bacteroidetes bacterium]|jgi:2-polyprenyl-6-hydroxyphenyl methylase/3-demethylubiquinone-9 3-methyltransferase|nr:class I SAM-dependent methyltransferase [Bacteroidota bacterium]MBT6687119.1 class I SAM-dependent methyltransferase [Bacteroidota bacterium]MBT7145150.1 class I SAM-dependent methyltransferase [Bacteroidota bacterium]MBT7491917.1 class I SAM-dependent methyltransferase [Bacteroidota bacterium]
MINYYSEILNSSNLEKCYEIAPPRVKQFLQAEINFVLNSIKHNDLVLDLGCGYGRIAFRLLEKAKKVVGIDISKDNVQLAKKTALSNNKLEFYVMDAKKLDFPDSYFTTTICVQNGISAFKVDPLELLKESVRVTKKGGTILYSSYSEKFWNHRLKWFEIQSENKLIGEIDYELTKNGTIVCKDGFTATTYSRQEFLELASKNNVQSEIFEIDNSSIFCKMKVK